ncbi:vWA domain-containing protein [Desulfovibrio legallii]|uniref:VWA domain-containing protein n=2 Tax=Desulfovibrio TaxID=872 RepID=A0A6H3FAN0_9BACT|nr:vWA domain-containing protein [Desulfovibrio legallii]RHH22915.1 VWA domain-containing protein [Desulfovibrio sp. AM18-2]TBH81136.1 VWA domain-containing protein [Desulfovibrio legallii]CAI3228262.1 serine/threonine protein kinase PpkA [Desulfovibrio diazotrophicus]VVU43173.1 serine/threonine protein kinase PpkA [Desulfovibrio diazotrophicus]
MLSLLRPVRRVCCCLLLALTALQLSALWAEAAPLLQEGKKSLYQRVVSHPGAALLAEPKADAAVLTQAVTPFTVFYVYARQEGWLQVGVSTSQPQGWLEAAKTTAWNQSLTLLFSPRTGRDPVLFFRTRQALDDLCAAPDMETRLTALEAQAAALRAQSAPAPESLPIVAAEPADAAGAVSEKRFYLMPILDMKDPYAGVKFLQVASIDPGNYGKNKNAPSGPPKTGIALVLDTSISMKPYIDQSLNVVRQIYDSIEKSNLADKVGFAVVAFRSSTKARPGLEYTTKVVSDFATAKDRKSLENNLAKVQEATVSSHDFNEDSLAGVQAAVQDLNWGPYASRLILLISDAGPLRSTDPYASVRMGPSEVNDLARQKGIWITALHVKSPAGRANHAYAEQSYRALSRLSGEKSNYQAVAAPTPQAGAAQFAAVTKTLASGMLDMVRNTAAGKIMTKPKDEKPQKETPETEAARLAATLGYAMQLEYLGRARENQAPSVVNSWIADMDLARLARKEQVPSVEVAVLLTKNQLSDLSSQLKTIIDNAERTKKTDARDFFQGVLSASTRMARDPNLPTQGKTLAELGVLAEFLDGLPYKSDVMLLREEDWYRMSVGEQTTFINRLKSRLARYEEYDRDRANWENFGQTDAGEWVYRVPLRMLP